MSRFLMFSILILLLVLGYLFIASSPDKSQDQSDASLQFNDRKIISAQIGSKRYNLFVSDTEAQRSQGLSNIETMLPNEGMIFIFDSPAKYGFWMKDMQFSLDLLYLYGNNIVAVREDLSPKTYPQTFAPSYTASKVIELNAGEVMKNGVNIGDQIKLK